MPEDDVCGICRVQFDGTCPTCKFPGDGCPLREKVSFVNLDLLPDLFYSQWQMWSLLSYGTHDLVVESSFYIAHSSFP